MPLASVPDVEPDAKSALTLAGLSVDCVCVSEGVFEGVFEGFSEVPLPEGEHPADNTSISTSSVIGSPVSNPDSAVSQ